MKESETVKEYAAKLLELVNKIRLFGEQFPDSKVVEKIWISLPSRFEPKVSAIEESCDLKVLSVAELISKLQAQEQRSSLRDEDTSEGAFQARQKGRQPSRGNQKSGSESSDKGKAAVKEGGKTGKFPPCSVCKKTNHLVKDCWTKDKSKVQCRFCRKFGHFEKFCKAKQNQMRNQNQTTNQQQANYTDEQEEDEAENVFMASQVTRDASQQTWYIDSGCTSHMAKEEIRAVLNQPSKRLALRVSKVSSSNPSGTLWGPVLRRRLKLSLTLATCSKSWTEPS